MVLFRVPRAPACGVPKVPFCAPEEAVSVCAPQGQRPDVSPVKKANTERKK